MSEHGKFVGATPFGEDVLPSVEDGTEVESSEGEYDPGVFTQVEPEPDPVQQPPASVSVCQHSATDPGQHQHATDPVEKVATKTVERSGSVSGRLPKKGGKRKSVVAKAGSGTKK